MIRIISAEEFLKMPWKNGGGVTHEVYKITDPQGALNFRLSVAEVASSGPYSIFPAIDRTLYLLTGEGFRLSGLGEEVLLSKTGAKVNFPGELAIQCQLLAGPCTDFNVMVNRNFGSAESLFSQLEVNQTLSLIGEVETFWFFCEGEFEYQGQKLKSPFLIEQEKGEEEQEITALSKSSFIQVRLSRKVY